MKRVNSLTDVIAAISTPIGPGGIAIIRLSGDMAIEVADRLFFCAGGKKLKDQSSHTIHYGFIRDPENGDKIDEVMVTLMKGPRTYTREDVIEINCHGGILVAKQILEYCLNYGARLAEPGEFTKRAFLNGRIDLSQAEAVIDVIQAKTELSRQNATNQIDGNLSRCIKKIREKILDMTAAIEAAIDYPDQDIEEETYQEMEQGCNEVLEEIKKLLATSKRGKILREGISTVILGKPNVGKSSLLNYLLNEERAIVTNIPGTTRDAVEESINLDGIPMKIVDTAGIRETDDLVEKIGVEKSKSYAKDADLLLLMLDQSRHLEKEDREILKLIEGHETLALLNKSDLPHKLEKTELLEYLEENQILSLSVKNNEGLTELAEKCKDIFFHGNITVKDEVLIGNVRHKNALFGAKEALERALETIRNKMPEDFISMDYQDALRFLGEITGDTMDEEIIDRIFTKFCLGK